MHGQTSIEGENPCVHIVTPVFNKIELTRPYLDSLRKIAYDNIRVIIVDDGSSDGTSEVLAREYPEVIVLQGDGNLWWAGGTNMGVTYALERGADYILTLNNDTQLEPDFLSVLVATAQQHPRSIVGCRIQHLHDRQLIWAVGGFMDWGAFMLFNLYFCDRPLSELTANPVPDPFEVDMVCGNGALFPAACFREVGIYDNRRFPQYHADTEMCLRARERGAYRVLVALDAVIYNDSENIGGVGVEKVWDQLFSIRSYLNVRLYFGIIKYCPGGFGRRVRMRMVYAWMFGKILVFQVWAPWLLRRFRRPATPPNGA